jgi:hypothetical protein
MTLAALLLVLAFVLLLIAGVAALIGRSISAALGLACLGLASWVLATLLPSLK